MNTLILILRLLMVTFSHFINAGFGFVWLLLGKGEMMLNTKKNISKSVRLTEEVFNYIDNFEGDGFNQKLENLVLFCMKNEDSIRDRISYLQSKIVSVQKSYNFVTRGSNDITRLLREIDSFNVRFEKLVNDYVSDLESGNN